MMAYKCVEDMQAVIKREKGVNADTVSRRREKKRFSIDYSIYRQCLDFIDVTTEDHTSYPKDFKCRSCCLAENLLPDGGEYRN